MSNPPADIGLEKLRWKLTDTENKVNGLGTSEQHKTRTPHMKLEFANIPLQLEVPADTTVTGSGLSTFMQIDLAN